MTKRVDITGQRLGKLTVIEFAENKYQGKAYWRCLCDCGNITVASGQHLRSGVTTSCGCAQRRMARELLTTHNDSKSKEFTIWFGIKQRCYNQNSSSYSYYGGRGIKMCDRWFNSYENFLADMGRAPSQKHTIERSNVNEHYSPVNCRWATRQEQSNNTRANIMVDYNGHVMSLTLWCYLFDLNYPKVSYRLKSGWNINKAFSTD